MQQRFNKSQQDLFLPHVESGTVTLITSTTENPSFRINGALLSRSRVFVLEKLSPDDLLRVLKRALDIVRREGLGDDEDAATTENVEIDDELLRFLASAADGDARVALSSLELALSAKQQGVQLSLAEMKTQLRKAHLQYDRSGDHHYDTISALHKSVRGGDANAALYWLARMLEAGDDPLYVARRIIRMASEDIGLANPSALQQCVVAYQATQLIGMPECDVRSISSAPQQSLIRGCQCILAQCVVMLAESPKSVRIYKAYGQARSLVKKEENYPVP